MTTKTQAERTSAKALSRFVAVAAVLLTLCLVFMMPVGAEVTLVGSGTENEPYAVASFDELQAAFNAESSTTIWVNLSSSFSADGPCYIPEGKSVVLDLKGFTITATDKTTTNYGFFTVKKGATFTLNDSDGKGKMTLTATTNSGWNRYSALLAVERGTAIINGGTLEHRGGTDMAYGVDVLTNGNGGGDAKLTVKGGSISSPYIGIRGFCNAVTNKVEITIEDGSISGSSRGIWIQQPSDNKNGNYVLGITGGEISGGNNAIRISLSGGDSTQHVTSISGATLKSTSADAATIAFTNNNVDKNPLTSYDASVHKVVITGKYDTETSVINEAEGAIFDVKDTTYFQ